MYNFKWKYKYQIKKRDLDENYSRFERKLFKIWTKSIQDLNKNNQGVEQNIISIWTKISCGLNRNEKIDIPISAAFDTDVGKQVSRGWQASPDKVR